MNIVAVLYDHRDLSNKTKEFLDREGWVDSDKNVYWLTERDILDSFEDDEKPHEIPQDWWEDSGFSMEQRKTLEKLWSMGNGHVEARWERA